MISDRKNLNLAGLLTVTNHKSTVIFKTNTQHILNKNIEEAPIIQQFLDLPCNSQITF